jgi:DNA-binding response OmpR family regulator
MHLLLIEDNPDLIEILSEFFESRGHTLDIAYNGPSGLGFALDHTYDVIILDLMLPGMDGLEVCSRLRREQSNTPVIMLTARDTLQNKQQGFSSGADDYLVKPFALAELEMRVEALTRRGQHNQGKHQITVGDLKFDPDTLHLQRAGKRIDLPPIPLKILAFLLRRSPGVVSRAEIEREIWGDTPPDSDTLRAHLHVLRNAIDKDFETTLLHTVRGLGYKLALIPDHER